MSTLLDRFADMITACSEDEIRADVTLDGRLILDQEGPLTVSYAPIEHIQQEAEIVIVGITPGGFQAAEALIETRRQLLVGADQASALRAAKVHASFSGQMRNALVAMLNHIGLHRHLGIASSSALWGSHAHLAHFTSALRYPVFRSGENYRGTPLMTRTPVLRKYLAQCLAEEARTLSQALWVPCGPKAREGVQWLVQQHLLSKDQVLFGMPHPSGANNERIGYFLGRLRREQLSQQTNPDLIDTAKEEMMRRVEGAAS
ncbi:hypothetical protein [Microvirga splendida]|uniref:Uracil DNA glycosylase superfamily protein n=1 Tax=Microvirga splendida TaxID=2795727 RepID=A0ABS0Y521_9HYPH|nr:hypothetical protein [Microvirga splendida]MBJ6127386.1 hypothetical protein [Microvirga splendida]